MFAFPLFFGLTCKRFSKKIQQLSRANLELIRRQEDFTLMLCFQLKEHKVLSLITTHVANSKSTRHMKPIKLHTVGEKCCSGGRYQIGAVLHGEIWLSRMNNTSNESGMMMLFCVDEWMRRMIIWGCNYVESAPFNR